MNATAFLVSLKKPAASFQACANPPHPGPASPSRRTASRIMRGTLGVLAALSWVASSAPAAPPQYEVIASVSGTTVAAMDVVGNRAYVLHQALNVYDISDPVHPSHLGGSRISSGWNGADIQVVGNHAYIAASTEGFLVYEVSNPSLPVRLARVPGGNVDAVEVTGNLACVAAGSKGLRLIDVSDPANPQLLGDSLGTGISAPANGATRVGNLVYVAFGTAGLGILDVSDPRAPRLLGLHDTPKPALYVQVQGSVAYVCLSKAGILAVDVSVPAQTRTLGFASVPDPRRIRLDGGLGYVADYEDALRVFDLSNPAAMTQVAYFWTVTPALDVRLAGNLAFVSCWNGGYKIVQRITAPTFTAHPSSQRVLVESGVVLTCRADGSPSPGVRWQVSVNSGASWQDLVDDANVGGSATDSLVLRSVPEAWSGYEFRAVATNKAGTAFSEAAVLTVEHAFKLGPVQTFAGFLIQGTPGTTCRIEAAESAGGVWQPLETVKLSAPTQWWIDPSNPVQGSRIYRAVVVP